MNGFLLCIINQCGIALLHPLMLKVVLVLHHTILMYEMEIVCVITLFINSFIFFFGSELWLEEYNYPCKI